MDVLIKDIRPGLKNLNVVFIVLEIGLPKITKDNREVRALKVADGTACINVSIWDEPGQLLFPGDIVRMTNSYATVWRNCLTLYSGKNGDIQKIGDFCMVFNEQVNMSEPNPQLVIPGAVRNNGNGNGTGHHSAAPTNVQQQHNSVAQTGKTNSRFTESGSNGNKPQPKPAPRGKTTHRNGTRNERR